MFKLFFILITYLTAQNLYALDDNSYANGWYWGKDIHPEDEKNAKPQMVTKIVRPNKSNSEILSDINKEIDELKATAILNPTSYNVANYIAAQNRVVNMASNFTKRWDSTMTQKPELNYISTHPTNNYAQQILAAEKQDNTQAALNVFAKDYGLIFFFKGQDKLAAFQSKIIKSITAKYNIAIIPVAINNVPNEYFPNLTQDNGRASKLGIKITPAIIAMHSKTGNTTPLAFGVVSESELEERISNFIEMES